ncbi:putative 39 kDa protein in mitochondrial S-1 and S-2 DNA [Apium graveolens]|uniref:putative 39 kDa protein in mitochondrial S-1 and S-2 DNA n=1 Tax=Apium graveolens TaxID=4045 RepID=UPI003D7BE37D
MGIVLHSLSVSNVLRSQNPFEDCIRKRWDSSLCRREQLLEDILFVYNDLTSTTRWSMPHDQFKSILRQICSDEYHLSPLRYLLIPEYDFTKVFVEELVLSYPDIMFRKCRQHPGSIEVLLPHNDDVVVYTGLSRFLYRLSLGSLPHNEDYRILNQSSIEAFYKSLLGRRAVRLYCIELDESLNFIPKKLLLETLSPILLDRSVYRLISELMELNINHKDMYYPPSPYGIPALGEICRFLFNLFLVESFDPCFAQKYPGIEFVRYFHTIFLFIQNDEQNQAFFGIEDMLADLDLINGYIKSIDTLGCMYSRIGLVKKVFRIAPDGTIERGEDRFDFI